MKTPIVVAAGGTGGHLFPAEALAEVLTRRGWAVHLISDGRAQKYGEAFERKNIHLVVSASLVGSLPKKLLAGLRLAVGLIQAGFLLRRLRPAAAIGFGGYPSVPPMLAAAFLGIPALIHEQNGVLGRANRFLAPRMSAIAVTSDRIAFSLRQSAKVSLTGNPVRPAVALASAAPYAAPISGGSFRLLVFGGSQGARFFSELLPACMERLEPALLGKLKITQQCREEDMDEVRAAYERLGISAELAPFFRDLPARIAVSHLVVSRSGASTVAELAAIGRPAIMVPLPGALDLDQNANAMMLSEAGGGWMILQKDLTPERLAAELGRLMAGPEQLVAAATVARGVGRLDAAERLADLVEAVAGEQK